MKGGLRSPFPYFGELRRLRNHALHRAFDRAVHLVAKIGYRLPTGNPARYGAELLTDIPYREGRLRAHTLDIYRPKAARSPAPVVFYVHGGGFSMLSKDTHRLMALAFASRGYVVVNINYRMGRRFPFPTPLEDAGSALLWTRDHIRELGGDPERMVIAGESAGGNLVTALALCLSVDRPEPFAKKLRTSGIRLLAAMPIYGLLDVTDMDRFSRKHRMPAYVEGQVHHAALSYLGHPVHENGLRLSLASPLRVLEKLSPADAVDLPPFFAAAGTKDPLLDDSRRLKAELERLGIRCDLVIHPGEIHGYNAMMWRPAARDMWNRAFGFLEEIAPTGVSPQGTSPSAEHSSR